MWSLPVALTTGIAEGTALVGDFRRSCLLYEREAPRVDWTEATQDAVDLLATNQRVYRAETRAGFAVMRPAGSAR